MLDTDQLIAVAEVLGVDACGDCDPCIVGRPDQCAVSPYPNWLTSLDACFGDIVPAAKGYFELSKHPATGEWYCYFGPRNGAFATTAPRAIVKAFLKFNNRWIE
jgi:hypothetical protein